MNVVPVPTNVKMENARIYLEVGAVIVPLVIEITVLHRAMMARKCVVKVRVKNYFKFM